MSNLLTILHFLISHKIEIVEVSKAQEISLKNSQKKDSTLALSTKILISLLS
jgi:hypothetical protein